MTEIDVIEHWRKGAKDALHLAGRAYEDGLYTLALFNVHLAVEKAMKASYMEKHRVEAPWTHNLVPLGKEIDHAWTEEELRLLGNLTQYAIAARYDDPVWAENEATQENAGAWIERASLLLSSLIP
jgi:HEPN domain-containing protein